MNSFTGTIGAKAAKFNLKVTLLVLCLIVLLVCFSSELLTAMNVTLFTNSAVSCSWCLISDSRQSLRLGNSFIERRFNYVASHQPDGPRSKCFPACIIFGVSKCGTRALLEYLTLHPEVVAPIVEINFFCNKSLIERGVTWYVEQMPYSMPHQITVEKSPDYFQCHECADLIYAIKNSTKLILLLRDPVERLVSQYMQFLEKHPGLPNMEQWVMNPDTHSINTKLPSVMVSAYSEHLSHWLSVFPRNQIHIIESDSLRVNPLEEMKQIEKFLNLKPFFASEDFYFNSSRGFYCTRRRSTGKTKCLGKSKGRDHISVDKGVLDKLHRFYHPYNERLNKLLGFRFSWS